MSDPDEKYMKMALDLAARGIGNIEPNPAVGCVIVKKGRVIGKGCHEEFGQAHAEINALADCQKNHNNPAGATMYVTLEPCCHVGKTGPCTDAIINAKITRLVAAIADPSDHVGSKGIEKLKKAGLDVKVNVCLQEAKLLNAWFFRYAATKRPWVILKWAQSIDGKMAAKDRGKHGRWISNEKSRRDVHKLRRSVQGILIGIETVLADDPMLTARPPRQNARLIRIVLDSGLRIPLECKLMDTAAAPTIVATTQEAVITHVDKSEAIIEKGAEILALADHNNMCDIDHLLDDLGKKNIQRLLVEGGPTVLTSFIERGLADAVRVYISPNKLGSRGTAEITEAMSGFTDPAALHHACVRDFDGDVCISGFTKP